MPIPCSRNVHDQNVLVRRAQWDRAWVPFQEREVSELGGTIYNRGRSMRAVKDSLATPPVRGMRIGRPSPGLMARPGESIARQ